MGDGILGPWSFASLERRSRLRRLDDLLEALEVLNLQDAPSLSAAVTARLDELGIPSEGSGPPFTELVNGVLKAQERFMIQGPAENRRRPRRAPFDARTLSLRLDQAKHASDD
jgi:hypothetical protein